MFKKIITMTVCMTIFAGQMSFAVKPDQSRRVHPRKKIETQKQQAPQQNGAAPVQVQGQAGQGDRQQQLTQLENQLRPFIAQGKQQEVIAAIGGMVQQQKLTEAEAEGLIARLGLSGVLAKMQAQSGSSLFGRIQGLSKVVLTKIVAHPIRSILCAAGTVAAARMVYKYGLWSKLKEWGRDSWQQLTETFKYDNKKAGTVVTVKKGIPMGKALTNLIKGRWVKTRPYKAWKAVATFTKEAATLVKHRGIPQINVTLPYIDKKKAVWEIVKNQGGSLIDILSPVEHPVSRVLGGVGL